MPPKRTIQPCSIDGCEKPRRKRGVCVMHYERWRRHGSFDDPRRTLEERFWSKVDKSGGCWEWTASYTQDGYGWFGVSHRHITRAHRVAWFLKHGEWPELCVLHRCDNPKCVRPSHLFLGTIQDNNLDKLQKGRQSHLKGERNPRAILTASDVVAIRKAYANGEMSVSVIARQYGMSSGAIYGIIYRLNWKHVN